jgi:signal-transduction protein with cAMP-binding, CBS, and nucleotidyltransferase domain
MNLGCLMVEEEGKLCGILTDRDIALKVTEARKDPEQTTVREVMTTNPACISVDKGLPDLTALMHSRQVRRVPIVDGEDKLIGMVTLDDLLVLLSEEMADMSQSVSAAIFRKPIEAVPGEPTASLKWLMYYL